jgi:hypothetical protein
MVTEILPSVAVTKSDSGNSVNSLPCEPLFSLHLGGFAKC